MLPSIDRKSPRQLMVVDVATTGKLSRLRSLESAGLLDSKGSRISVAVDTHPHDDHIGGMTQFLEEFGDRVNSTGSPGIATRPGPTWRRCERWSGGRA
jgi:glyoxylase-like metal-dependent hydrolase (beta-lactamase superfamily II)